MSHRLSTVCLLFVCVLGMSLSLWGQNATGVHGIPGYLDPRTGAFHSVPQPDVQLDPAVEPPAVTTVGGKFVFNFTITVSSTIASTNKIACQASASVNETSASGFNTISESAAVAVTRGTGATITCSVTIPYSWKLASAATDMVVLNFSLISPVEVGVVTGQFPSRTSIQSLPSVKVPANGAITTETVTATI
jgi:hypothetical protein